MKLTIAREPLLAACRLAGRLLPEHPIGPAEEHFLLRAGPAGCSLHAAGPEATVRLPLAGQVDQAGEGLLPARATLAVLRAATADELRLEAGPDGLLLRWPGTRFRLESPPVSLFPPDEAVPAGPCHWLPAEGLSRAIRSTLFAAGPGSRRYRLEGVLFEAGAECVRVVATDNRRLAVASLRVPRRCQNLTPQSRVLCVAAVALLGRLAGSAEQGVEMRLGPERAFFGVGGALLSCRFETGPYPPWRSAVPPSPPHRLVVPVRGLLGAVRQAAVLREREAARLLLSLEPGRLVLESGRVGAGQARVARKVPFRGGPVRVALEPRYLVELLRCLEGLPTVELGLTDGETPALFRAGDYTHVLMPLRLDA